MARPDRDAARYQTDFLTNRGVGETSEAYSELVHEDSTAPRSRYALVVILFVFNLAVSLALLAFAISRQPPQSKIRWIDWDTLSASTSRSKDWMACRQHRTDKYCAAINEDFCQAASEVINSTPRRRRRGRGAGRAHSPPRKKMGKYLQAVIMLTSEIVLIFHT